MQRMNVHDYATQEDRSFRSRIQSAMRRKRVVYASLAVTVVLIVIVSLSVALTGDKKSASQSEHALTTNGPNIPVPEVQPPVQQTNKEELGAFLFGVYSNLTLSVNELSVENSPQFLALQWITGRDEYTSYGGEQRIQRYSLATFYYATFMKAHDFLPAPTDWSSQNGWLSDDAECTWEGIACNSDNQVIGIIMSQHALSGSLPVELALLPQLQELDFTTNFIYMEDDQHAVWKYMTQLRMLRMEDNFIVSTDGLPAEFAGLVNLEKLELSYNLLQGVMTDAVFQGMLKLQHLELESNYLSGEIPAAMGALTDLTYLYARRNLLTVTLSDMIVTNSYPSLFSLWLDNNAVTGSIPTALGTLTGLASFSVTNATLTGAIPTEFGLLTDLKRVWLYDNQLTGALPSQLDKLAKLEVFEIHDNLLTGAMPQTICSSVAASDYEFRMLTADCERVSCDNCCTLCYSG